ncbi:MAG: class I SAM-dependent methyltransferase [Desulfomonilaceae bacterium]|nr:class I SAM-dependent methyltransferase [Desulfomonilaceae bacterium]
MKQDREKWNSRYTRHDVTIPDPDPFLTENASLLTKGTALDLAAGLGANALFLARSGYGVDAIDISFPALLRLKAEADRLSLDIRPIVADLDTYPVPINRYDLVAIFYFFSPPIMSSIRNCMKRGGLLVCSTYNYRHTSIKPGFTRKYLVPRGGLAPYVHGLDIVLNENEAGEAGNLSRLIARKR